MKISKFFLPFIIVLGVTAFQSIFIVQEINQAIVLQFGDPKKIVTKSGLNFKLPFIQNVAYLDKRVLNLAIASTINLFWSAAITSSGALSKFKILLSKKTTF